MTVSLQWFPVLRPAVIVLLCGALVAALLYGSWLLRRKHVPRRWVTALGVLRGAMVLLLAIGLLQPVLSFPRSFTQSPDVLVLVDSSASMSAAAAMGSRYDELRRTLQDSPALQTAAQTHTLHWFTFDRRAYPTTAAGLDQTAPRGDGTDLAASLSSAWNYVRLQNASTGTGSLPTRALLVSDGQDHGAEDPVAVARQLGLTVDVLPPSRAADQSAAQPAEIVSVQSARRVLMGSETGFQVTLRAQGATNRLELVTEEDGNEIQRRDLTSLAVGQDQFVVVSHRPTTAGLKRYTFRLVQGDQPLDRPYSVNVQVADERHDVLMLEDAWRWEFKYLRRILEDDPSFSFTALLARGENAFVQFGEPERRVHLGGFPHSRSELDGFDTLILGDVRPVTWPRGLARHVHAVVAEGGKSLIVVAGPHLGEWVDTPELARLLPVELTRESGSPVSGQVEVRITPEGKESSWFTLALQKGAKPDSADVGAASAALPALAQVYPVLRKRPAATVLLETVAHNNPYGPLVVIAEHTVGRGRVLFIGTDTLWRWQTLGPRNDDGATLHSTFWQHALRALAPPESTSATAQLFLRPERTQYRSGDRVQILAELSSSGTAGPAAADATVVLPDGRRSPLALAADERAPGRFVAQFDAAQVGRYRIEASARSESQTLAEGVAVIEVSPGRTEMDDSPVDAAALARLAAATGGRSIDPSAADGWLTAEAAPPTVVVRRQAFDLWHNFTFLLALCTLMAVDWSLRLFRGYV